MNVRKQSIYLGIIGIAIGLFGGWFYADYYNKAGLPAGGLPPAANSSMPASGEMPPGHPQLSRISQEQIDAAKKNADQNSKDVDAQRAAAEMLYQASHYDEAATFYQRALQLRPDDIDIMVQIGNSYFDFGLDEVQQQNGDHSTEHFLEAAKWYEKVLEKKPDDVNVRTDYGLTFYYRRPQDLGQAVAQYQRSLQIQPDHPQTLANLTTALAEQGNTTEAENTLSKLEKLAPNTPLLAQALFNYTQALMGQEKWAEAKTSLAKLELIVPGDPIIAQMRKNIDSQRKGEMIQPH